MMTMTYNLTWIAAIPAGWRPILHDAAAQLHAIDPTIWISQAKEKFGSLRLHVDHGSAEACAVIDAARAKSERSCELCGADAQLRRTADGYYSTRCPDHASGFMPIAERPSVTFRIVVEDDGYDPAPERGETNASNGSVS